jgi:O-antigen ligase
LRRNATQYPGWGLNTAKDLKGTKIEQALFLLVCVALVWVPLPAASNRVWSSMGWSSLIFVICLLWSLAYLLGRVQLSSIFRRCYWPIGCLLLVQVIVLFQWLSPIGWSTDANATFRALLLGLSYLGLFLLILQFHSPQRIKVLLVLIFASTVFQALYGSMMVLTGLELGFMIPKAFFKGLATGTFVNPNHFAAYLNLGLAIGIAYLMVSVRKLDGGENLIGRTLTLMMSGSLAWRLAIIVLVVGLVMSSSRMANLAFMCALFGAAGAYMLIKRRLVVAWLVLIASVLVIDAVVVGARFGVDRLMDEVANTMADQGLRTSVLEATLPMARDFFWFGSGAGTFYSTFPLYRGDIAGSDFYFHAHNDYIEFLIELGIFGLLALAAFVGFTLRAAYVACTSSRSNWIQIAGYACFMSIVGIAIHSTADFSLRIPAYASSLMAIFAVTYSAAYGQRQRRSQHSEK